jgi:hypothetical protein
LSGGPGDFLSRWSRRKLDNRRADETPQPEASLAPIPDSSSSDDLQDELSPEEIEALPKIEEITPDTDITVFLRKGVPELLRKAALRRLWSVDPEIRDYVGDARDYAYDWNIPGGVPGNGPLLPTDDVEAMVDRVFGRRPDAESDKHSPAQETPQAASQSGEPEYKDEAGAPRQDAEPDDDAAQQTPDLPPLCGSLGVTGNGEKTGEVGIDAAPGNDAAPPMRTAPERARQPRRRRHGGARPV